MLISLESSARPTRLEKSSHSLICELRPRIKARRPCRVPAPPGCRLPQRYCTRQTTKRRHQVQIYSPVSALPPKACLVCRPKNPHRNLAVSHNGSSAGHRRVALRQDCLESAQLCLLRMAKKVRPCRRAWFLGVRLSTMRVGRRCRTLRLRPTTTLRCWQHETHQ